MEWSIVKNAKGHAACTLRHPAGMYTYTAYTQNGLQFLTNEVIMPIYAPSVDDTELPTSRHITMSITALAALHPANPQDDNAVADNVIVSSSTMDETIPHPPSENQLQASIALLNHHNTVLLAGLLDQDKYDTECLSMKANCASIKQEQSVQEHYINPTSTTIHALNADGTYELWHQRLNHSSPDIMYETQKRVIGIPKLKRVDDLEKCDSCIKAKITKQMRGTYILTEPEHVCQQIQADFGFIAIPKEEKRIDTKPVCNTKLASSMPKGARTKVPPNPKIKV
jgi:hypothetical protein